MRWLNVGTNVGYGLAGVGIGWAGATPYAWMFMAAALVLMVGSSWYHWEKHTPGGAGPLSQMADEAGLYAVFAVLFGGAAGLPAPAALGAWGVLILMAARIEIEILVGMMTIFTLGALAITARWQAVLVAGLWFGLALWLWHTARTEQEPDRHAMWHVMTAGVMAYAGYLIFV